MHVVNIIEIKESCNVFIQKYAKLRKMKRKFFLLIEGNSSALPDESHKDEMRRKLKVFLLCYSVLLIYIIEYVHSTVNVASAAFS